MILKRRNEYSEQALWKTGKDCLLEVQFLELQILRCFTIQSHLKVSDPGNEKFQRGWRVSPLKAITTELNMAATTSSEPSWFRSANTGGDMIPFASSLYSS
jgi:hypothetical protein